MGVSERKMGVALIDFSGGCTPRPTTNIHAFGAKVPPNIESKEMWQHTEALIRSQLRTFKTKSNHSKSKLNKEKCKSISRPPKPSAIQDNSETEQTRDSKCTQLLTNIKQCEYEYIKEFEKKIAAEENGEDFDHSALERIGTELESLEIALKASQEIAKPQDDDDFNSNLNNHETIREIKGVGIKKKFRSCIPIPIDEIVQVRRKLNLETT